MNKMSKHRSENSKQTNLKIMNKIYSDPILKAHALADGVKKRANLLAQKGIKIDVEKLNATRMMLEEAGKEQDAAEAKLREAREHAHECLEELKNIYTLSKTPIKENFSPEIWFTFGLQDKK